MKRKLGIGIILCIVLIVVLLFNENKEMRLPQCGIYGIEQNSFYSFNENEEKEIYIDVYRISLKEHRNSFLFEGFEDFALLDNSGKEYPILFQEENVLLINYDYEHSKKVDLSQYTVRVTIPCEEDIVFVAMKCRDMKGEIQTFDLGNIEVCMVQEEGEDVTAYSNRISWVSYYQPTFEHVELILTNEGEQNVTVSKLSYGDKTGISLSNPIDIQLAPSEELEITFEVELTKKENGTPIVYYLKPVIEYRVADMKKYVGFSNISKESFYGEEEDIFEYLYKLSKKDKYNG